MKNVTKYCSQTPKNIPTDNTIKINNNIKQYPQSHANIYIGISLTHKDIPQPVLRNGQNSIQTSTIPNHMYGKVFSHCPL